MRIISSCMDRKDDCIIPSCGIMPEPHRDYLLVGARQIRKALAGDKVRQVILARDADFAVTEPIARSCGQLGVEVRWVDDMAALGSACGIDVGTAAAAVLK